MRPPGPRLICREGRLGYLIDTSALSAYLNPDHPHHAFATAVINQLPEAAPKLVSIVTLAEFDYGIRFAELAGSARLEEYRQRLEVVRKYAPLDVTHHTSEAYAELKILLAARVRRRPGKKMRRWIEDWVELGSAKRLQIDENDLWIAAQAKERDLVIITGDSDMRILASVDPEVRIQLTSA